MSTVTPLGLELEVLRKRWGLMLIMGILLILVGAAAIGAQVFATFATVMILGAMLIVGGVIEVLSAFSAPGWRGFGLHLLAGILYVVLGLIMIDQPFGTAAGITLMLAFMLIAGGIFRILAAVTQRFHGWGWVLLNGLVSLFLGFVIWRRWVDASTFIIGLFVGIDMVFDGWSWVLTALAIRNIPKQVA